MKDEQEKKSDVQFPEDGTVLQTPDGAEKVVHDLDDDGNVVGWHKEPA